VKVTRPTCISEDVAKAISTRPKVEASAVVAELINEPPKIPTKPLPEWMQKKE
jgi:hypothetical protein